MLVISLTVVEYFSKRVFNDVIKLEVSTGVGYFFGGIVTWSESYRERFLTSYTYQLIQNIWAYLLLIDSVN